MDKFVVVYTDDHAVIGVESGNEIQIESMSAIDYKMIEEIAGDKYCKLIRQESAKGKLGEVFLEYVISAKLGGEQFISIEGFSLFTLSKTSHQEGEADKIQQAMEERFGVAHATR